MGFILSGIVFIFDFGIGQAIIIWCLAGRMLELLLEENAVVAVLGLSLRIKFFLTWFQLFWEIYGWLFHIFGWSVRFKAAEIFFISIALSTRWFSWGFCASFLIFCKLFSLSPLVFENHMSISIRLFQGFLLIDLLGNGFQSYGLSLSFNNLINVLFELVLYSERSFE